jgi:hypothetical protein
MYIKLGFVIKIKWIIHKRLFYIVITSFHPFINYILLIIFLFDVTYDATFISDDEGSRLKLICMTSFEQPSFYLPWGCPEFI